MISRAVTILFLVLGLFASSADSTRAHALQPGFLDLDPRGGDIWSVLWKVPDVSGNPMKINALLPDNCDVRSGRDLRLISGAWITRWVATCPGGLGGGRIAIEGLESTTTDVLVRYSLRQDNPGLTHRLDAKDTEFVVPEVQGWASVLKTYVFLGVDHILEGIDHLLFVFALLLLIRSKGKLIGAVTAFTIAHSITLAASAMGWIVLPVAPVEAVIALSIVFLASEIVAGSGKGQRLSERFPWAVSFSFGLLHGLGFASALLDIGLPQGEVPVALLAFNIGVEIGQLLFIATVLVIGALFSALIPGIMRYLRSPGGPGMLVSGYAIGGLAAFWTIERIAAF